MAHWKWWGQVGGGSWLLSAEVGTGLVFNPRHGSLFGWLSFPILTSGHLSTFTGNIITGELSFDSSLSEIIYFPLWLALE